MSVIASFDSKIAIIFTVGDILFEKVLRKRQWYRRLAIFDSKIRLFFMLMWSMSGESQRNSERPTFFPVHVDSYGQLTCGVGLPGK